MQAHVPTLMGTISLASLTMASVIVVVGWGTRRDGLQLWAGGIAVQAAGYLFLGLRGQIDETLSILAGNALTSLALSLLLDEYSARVAVCSALFAAQAGAVVVVLYARRRRTVGRGVWLLMAGMGTEALLMALRAGATGTQEPHQLLQSSLVQTTTFLGTFAILLITSLGFIFMTKERADETNRLLASADPLTGAANRRSIIEAFDREPSARSSRWR